jgi:hypothetical protein
MITRRISFSLAVAGFILAAAAGLKYAQFAQVIDADTARRAIQVIIGLVLAVYGNFMPKDIARARSVRAQARVQSALRVGGWAMALAGLIHAGLWAFAPIAVAHLAAMAVVATATLVTMAYAGWAFRSCKRTENI